MWDNGKYREFMSIDRIRKNVDSIVGGVEECPEGASKNNLKNE